MKTELELSASLSEEGKLAERLMSELAIMLRLWKNRVYGDLDLFTENHCENLILEARSVLYRQPEDRPKQDHNDPFYPRGTCPDDHNVRYLLEMKVPPFNARPNKFKVIGVDTFDQDADAHWVYADWDTLEDAKKCADFHGGTMTKTHVYDDQGRHVYEAGSF